ncbi:hypothetical protein EV178_001727 [Coemansia sp. RSA 1646]|nr:hypothetical protein EV178_001727 [Coemansia sp. RSA 1646]KAJ2092959.1 hypothetical protein IW138_000673 [Coemansia sp. RSA 986]
MTGANNEGSAVPLVEHIPLDPLHWTYSGEGNANMLFSYSGIEPELHGWMLRFLKCPRADVDPAIAADNRQRIIEQANAKKLQERVLYTTKVIGSLVGDEYILPQRQVAVTRPFLCQLSAAAEQYRPKRRLDRQIDVDQVTAVLTQSLHYIPATQDTNTHSVTIEIKPKWGFLPKSQFITDEMAVSKSVCYFCLKQHSQADANQERVYCSLDLFSGDQTRVEQALDRLALSNLCKLRVFIDGHSMSSDENVLDTSQIPEWSSLKKVMAEIVAIDQLFPRLKCLQSQLDQFDIEGVFPMFQRALANGHISKLDPSTGEWLHAASEFSKRSNGGGNTKEISDKQAVLEFMMSTTLKDVSVLISLKQWPLSQIEDPQILPEYSVAVIDADIKHIAKVPEYLKKKHALVARYLKTNPDPSKRHQCCE